MRQDFTSMAVVDSPERLVEGVKGAIWIALLAACFVCMIWFA